MAIDKVEKDEKVEEVAEVAAPVDPRQERWNKLWEDYKKRNPVKYEAKVARGENLVIPDSFK